MFGKNSGGAAWLLVCLGNPGDKYENTRHNVGFMVADEIGERQNAPIQKLKFKALTNLFTISGQKVLVMKPVTYMNLSGEAVRQAVDFYKIQPDPVLVVSDDTALALAPRTRHCSVRTASAWMPRSTVPPGASCCGSARRLADVRREMQSSRGDTGCPVNTSFTPSGRIGWTDGTANRISLLPATARRLRLPEGGIAVPSRFRS